MKTTLNTLRKPFALVAAIATLQLCSCVSTDLLNHQAQVRQNLAVAATSGPSYSYILQERELEDIDNQIAQQRAASMNMALMVLGSPVVQSAITQGFNNAAVRNIYAPSGVMCPR